MAGGGHPLSQSERSFFEPRFGTDFSGVRLHTGATAGNLAETVQAKAFTVGSDIVFGRGQYAPGASEGKRLFAHELTHVVQQGDDNQYLRRQEGEQLASKADLEKRKQLVVSIERSGTPTISGFADNKTGNVSGYQLHQDFTLILKKQARASDYAIVQWIKGEMYEDRKEGKAYWPANTGGALYGRTAKEPWLFKNWIIDSPDADPRFGSDRGVKVKVPTTKFSDSPGIIMTKGEMPAGLRWMVQARMGVYPWGNRIPTSIKDWESMRPDPFKEVHWGWDITVKQDKKSLDVEYK